MGSTAGMHTLIIDTTNLVVSSNLLMSTSKWFSWFAFAFSSTARHLSRTAPMLRRYPAGSTFGSGAFGSGILGSMEGIAIDIFEKPGVAGVTGDFSDDCEDMDAMSARLDEFLREPPEVVDSDVFLREKRPMARGSVVGRTYRGMMSLSRICV
jgi:hypothetical protein